MLCCWKYKLRWEGKRTWFFRIYRLIEVELQNGRQLCAGIIENRKHTRDRANPRVCFHVANDSSGDLRPIFNDNILSHLSAKKVYSCFSSPSGVVVWAQF